MAQLSLSKIPNLNTIVMKQDVERAFFIASPTAIVIGVDGLATLLLSLIENDILSYKVLEGILEEYHSSKKGE